MLCFGPEYRRSRVAKVVRYQPDRDNSVLKMALRQVWKSTCYWCGAPKDFTDTVIDHIVPKSVSPAELDQLKIDHRLRADFDLDAPYNLAPICHGCNGMRAKGDQVLLGFPKVYEKLQRASHYADQVVQRVANFDPSNKLAESMLAVTMASTKIDANRRLFTEHGPSLLQKLTSLIDVEELSQIVTVRAASSTIAEISAELDSRGRATITILDEFCAIPLLENAADYAFTVLLNEVHEALEAVDVPGGYPTISEPEVDSLSLRLRSIDFSRDGAVVEVTIVIDCDGLFSAIATHSDQFGDELQDTQVEAFALGSFSISGYMDIMDSSGQIDWISDFGHDNWVIDVR